MRLLKDSAHASESDYARQPINHV